MEKESLPRRTYKVAGTLVLFGAFLGLLVVAVDLFLLAFLAILLALGLRGLAGLIASHTRLSPAWSLSFISIFMLGFLLLIGFLAAPRLANQANELSQRLPKVAQEAETKIRSHPIGEKILNRARDAAPGLQKPGKLLAKASGVFSKTFGALANLAFLSAMMVFFVLAPDTYRKPFVRLFPQQRRNRIDDVLGQVGHSLRMWLMGRVIRKAIDLPPALLLFSQVILGVTLGFLGLLLATPLMAAVNVLVRTLYLEDTLGAKPASG
ncbi:MAG: AI-2E family transporter [Fibrobacterota bacterium]|nr:AI-2E family transporter [Fibrobacterota bacterium]